MSTLDFPERPAGLPARKPREPQPWAAWWALPIALAAVVIGGLSYAAATAIRSALVELPAPTDGVFGVALYGPPPVLTLVATLAQDLTLVVGAVLVAASALRGRVTGGAFGLYPVRLVSSAGYVIGAYVLFLLVAAGWSTALGIQDRETIAIDLGTRDSVFALVAAGFLVCVVAPVAEELFFRGFLYGGLRKRGVPIAVLVSGAIFGLAHVASSPVGLLVPLAVLGMIFALLYERTGSLYPAIAMHALNNSVAFGVGDGRVWLIPIGLAASGLVVYGLSRLVGERVPRGSPVAAT